MKDEKMILKRVILLFSGKSSSDAQIFMVDVLESAVIDTACTRTVCGEKWLADYVGGLRQRELLKSKDKKSGRALFLGLGMETFCNLQVNFTSKNGRNCQ